MSDPLAYMNELLQWRDPPPPDEQWERKVATACSMIAERDAEIERISRCNKQQRAEIERLTAELDEARKAAQECAEYRSVPDDVWDNWQERFPWLEDE